MNSKERERDMRLKGRERRRALRGPPRSQSLEVLVAPLPVSMDTFPILGTFLRSDSRTLES